MVLTGPGAGTTLAGATVFTWAGTGPEEESGSGRTSAGATGGSGGGRVRTLGGRASSSAGFSATGAVTAGVHAGAVARRAVGSAFRVLSSRAMPPSTKTSESTAHLLCVVALLKRDRARHMVRTGFCGVYLAIRMPGRVSPGDRIRLVAGPREVALLEVFRSRARG